MSNIEKLNKELAAMGVEEINISHCPQRQWYLDWLNLPLAERPDNWSKLLKFKRDDYVLHLHHYLAEKYPYLIFETTEDKTFWHYNEQTGVYDELMFIEVRSLVVKILMDDFITDKATEIVAKQVIVRFKGFYQNRGHAYGDFDNDPDWFHCKNGWINTKTLKFEKHTPKRLSRRVSKVSYNKKAKCPIYDTFLDEQLHLAKDQVRVIDQFSGLLLTPDITKQKMLVLIGKPGSGKSTLLNCWFEILGDCAIQRGLHEISSESFSRFSGSDLVGKKLCWFDEVEVTRSNMSNALINLVTGHYIRVERKGVNGIIETPNQLKCVLTANTLPRSAEMGIYRRMILMYMEYSFYDNMTADMQIQQKLNKEASGILNRMLKGLADLRKHKTFTPIEGHDELIEEYKASSNTVAEFLDTYFVFNENAEPVLTTTLLSNYKRFCSDRYSDTLTPQRFGMLMRYHGLSKFDRIYTKKDWKGNRTWCGLQLKDHFEYTLDDEIVEKRASDF